MSPPREDLEREVLRLFRLARREGQVAAAEHLLKALEALAPERSGGKGVKPTSALAEAYRDIAARGGDAAGKTTSEDKQH